MPVTDAMLQKPSAADWLMWRRTLDGWGYSPLDQINQNNVGQMRMVWTRGMGPGNIEATPLVHNGVMYLPNPGDYIQAIDAKTGDLIWEYQRKLPEGRRPSTKRNIAIYGNTIISTSQDNQVYALDAQTGKLVWETPVLDPTKPRQRQLRTDYRQRQGDRRPSMSAWRRPRMVRHHGARCEDRERALADAHHSKAR
mgnify:CR=1 FL=1